MDKEVRKKRHLSQTQFIAYGFFAIILIGALLLMLPIANRGGKNLGFINCLLTATSATCVTGLVAADTWSQWTLFGQMVILAMIQIGGLGFITIGVFVSIILRRRVSLKARGLMQESMNTLQIGGIVRLAKKSSRGRSYLKAQGQYFCPSALCRSLAFSAGCTMGFFIRFLLSATAVLT